MNFLKGKKIIKKEKFYSAIPIEEKPLHKSRDSSLLGEPPPKQRPDPYEIEKTLTYPITVIGTRKRGNFRYYSWDFNIAFIKNRMNPDIFLTFIDSKGEIIGPVAFRGNLVSIGPKIELGIRFRIGSLRDYMGLTQLTCVYTHCLKGKQFNKLPQRIYVSGGWDWGLSVFGIGFSCTTLEMTNYYARFPSLRITMIGLGNATGIAKVKTGYFERLPYPFKPRWGRMEKAIFMIYLIIIYMLILYGISKGDHVEIIRESELIII